MDQIHGHEVLNMMLTSGKAYTRESLVADIHHVFGQEARFYTCSAKDMTAEELVLFLDARGKLVQKPDGFGTSADLMCDH